MKPLPMLLSSLCLLLDGGATAASAQAKRPSNAATRPVTVPFVMKQISGDRPVIAVKVNDTPFHMVIHSNAGFFMQIHHALAGKVGVTKARHTGAFGIQSKGHLSALGRDEATLRRLSIGGAVSANVPVSIFETPGDQDSGMLGLDWIRANRIIMSYADRTVRVNPSAADADAVRRTLLKQGYEAIPMTRNADTKRYSVPVTIGGVAKTMDVSTVTATTIDSEFAREAGVETGRVIGIYGGPKGSTGRMYVVAKPVALTVGAWQSGPVATATILDVYAYDSKERPATGAIGGQLATDVLIANGGVIDFGNQVLYLRRP